MKIGIRLALFATILIAFSSCQQKEDHDLLAALPVKDFVKPAENPVLGPDSSYTFFDGIREDSIRWQRADLFNPAAVVRDGKIWVLYRAEDNPAAAIGGRTSRLGLAWSEDGIHFTKEATPVLYPSRDSFNKYEYPGGCEDPRLVETADGEYIVAYTAWNGKTARLSIASSTDLHHWNKKGPAFAKAYQGKYLDTWSKSASMVTEWKDGKLLLAKIDGKYWMYWGERFINLAWSENGYDWNPLEDQHGDLLYLVQPRPKMFDSDLTECGPPAVITTRGVELLYNGKNANDSTKAADYLPPGTYSVGEIVFDPRELSKVISRSDSCFLKPTLPHERSGQYQAGTCFSEGLVYFQDKWFLYYGTADSYVGLAIGKMKQ